MKCIENFYAFKGTTEPKIKSYDLEYRKAFRYTVSQDVTTWKLLHSSSKPTVDAVADHVFPWTFTALLDAFLRYWSAWTRYGKNDGWLFDELPVREGGDWLEETYYPINIIAGLQATFYMPTLADNEMATMWRAFHARYATLRWLTPNQNAKCNHRCDAFPEIKGSCI
jgi:hypothetical protein